MSSAHIRHRYLQLLKKSLLNDLYVENEARLLYCGLQNAFNKPLDPEVVSQINRNMPDLCKRIRTMKETGDSWFILNLRTSEGQDLTLDLRNICDVAHSMIGTRRMDHLEACLDRIRTENIPGDLIETGVCRGGAVIFMCGYLQAYDMYNRTVWAADSFEGLPVPALVQDAGFDMSKTVYPSLSVSLEEVQELFRRYELMNSQVRFLKGWFADTLPQAPIEQLALLRLDGDLYASTMDALNALYHKVVPGGFVVVDDYNSVPPCRQAITDFREHHGLTQPLQSIDAASVFWRV